MAKTVQSDTLLTILYFYASKDALLDNTPILIREYVAAHVLGILQSTSRLKMIPREDAFKNAQQIQEPSATT